MANYSALLLYLSLLSSVLSQSSPSKLEQIIQLSDAESVIKLNAATFKKFVAEQTRNYIIVVLFSTIEQQSQCLGCSIVNPIFNQIAYSYRVFNYHKPSDPPDAKSKPIIFAILEYSESTHDIFARFQLSSIPALYISTKLIPVSNSYYNIDRLNLWEFKDPERTREDLLLNFINKRTDRRVEIQYSLAEKIAPVAIAVTLISLSLMLVIVIKRNYMNTLLWWAGGMLIYIICMGGVVYDVLHEPGWGNIDLSGDLSQLIVSGPRDQYVIEGFFMSFLISLAGCGAVIVNCSAGIENRWVMRIVGLIGIMIFVGCSYKVDQVYRFKAEWYTPTFSPPAHYIKGGLIADQGNSF